MVLEETLNYVLEDDFLSNDAKLIYSYLYSNMDGKRIADQVTILDLCSVINKSKTTLKKRLKELKQNNYIQILQLQTMQKKYINYKYVYILPKLNIINFTE